MIAPTAVIIADDYSLPLFSSCAIIELTPHPINDWDTIGRLV